MERRLERNNQHIITRSISVISDLIKIVVILTLLILYMEDSHYSHGYFVTHVINREPFRSY